MKTNLTKKEYSKIRNQPCYRHNLWIKKTKKLTQEDLRNILSKVLNIPVSPDYRDKDKSSLFA